jgi:hypothetical protein
MVSSLFTTVACFFIASSRSTNWTGSDSDGAAARGRGLKQCPNERDDGHGEHGDHFSLNVMTILTRHRTGSPSIEAGVKDH